MAGLVTFFGLGRQSSRLHSPAPIEFTVIEGGVFSSGYLEFSEPMDPSVSPTEYAAFLVTVAGSPAVPPNPSNMSWTGGGLLRMDLPAAGCVSGDSG